MKTITIAGRLTKDAVTRDAGSDRVTGFAVAVDNGTGKEKGTLFFDASWWGKRGEAVAQYLTKGTPVTVSGDLGTREHEGRTYLTVRVNDVTLQGVKQDGERRGGGGGEPQRGHDDMGDVPF